MLLWIEGFDTFGSSVGSAPSPTGIVGRKYSLTGNEVQMDVRDGRLGGYAIQLTYDSTCYISPGALTTNATMVLGAAVKFGTFSANQPFMAMYDGSTLGMNLYINTTGEISVRRGTTVLATTSGVGISSGAWVYIEFKVLCNNSTGTYELRVNGVNVLSDTGQDTQAGSNAYHTTFRLLGISVSSAVAVTFDDFYCLDGSGSTNNNFLGNVRVTTIEPVGDVANAWTRSEGSDNYALVDDGAICDDDNTYVEAANTGTKDLYNYANSSGETDIAGIMICTDCRETDANSFTLITVCNDVDDGGQVIGSTNYVTKTLLLETVPGGSNAWTASDIDSVNAGVKVG